MIVTKDLTKKFGKFTAVDRLNLNIAKGESYGFLGPNGAGKTTTLLMLLGILHPTSGEVFIDGQQVSSASFDLKRKIGVVAEYQTFYENMTAWEYVAFFARLYQVANVEERAADLFDRLKLTEWQNTLISAYSTGMKKKLGFIRALVHSPEILILDEPVSGLDPFGIIQVRSLLTEEKQRGVTLIISSHILSEVEQTADKVGIISQGKLILEDSMDNLRGTVGEGDTITLKIANLSAQDIENFSRLPYVKQLTHEGDQLTLHTQAGQDYRPQIGQFLVENGLIPLEMKRAETSLEEAYITISERNLETLQAQLGSQGGVR